MISSAAKRVGDDRLTVRTSCPAQFFQQMLFQVIGIRMHLAGCYLFICRSMETQLADTQTAFCISYRRAKRAAGNRPRRIQVACACCRIQHRADLIVRKLIEGCFKGVGFFAGFIKFRQQARHCIAGKFGTDAGQGIGYADADTFSTRGVGGLQCAETVAQTQSIELRDSKDADAALKAPWPANEVVAATACRVSERSIHDLHERGIRGIVSLLHRDQARTRLKMASTFASWRL